MSSITRTIDTGVALGFAIETTGYDGGDASVTTLSIRPMPGFQHEAEIFSLGRMYSGREGVIETDEATHISFQVRGDMELNALRQMLHEAAAVLDELLEDETT